MKSTNANNMLKIINLIAKMKLLLLVLFITVGYGVEVTNIIPGIELQ